VTKSSRKIALLIRHGYNSLTLRRLRNANVTQPKLMSTIHKSDVLWH